MVETETLVGLGLDPPISSFQKATTFSGKCVLKNMFETGFSDFGEKLTECPALLCRKLCKFLKCMGFET